MARPWYTYLLLLIGAFTLLVALGRPAVGVTSVDPGGALGPENRFAVVRPGSPLARAGVESGDRFGPAESMETSSGTASTMRPLEWVNGIPRSGSLVIERGGTNRTLTVQPVAPTWPVRFA